MKNNKRQYKNANRWEQRSSRSSSSAKAKTNFGSSESYVKAFSQIYYQEINDIDRFVSFANTYYGVKAK